MDWQPIETAPKDGTVILLYGECDGEIHGLYREKSINVGSSKWGGEFHLENTDCYGVQIHATHWQPLPAPPEAP